jgi:hypothetical protein
VVYLEGAVPSEPEHEILLAILTDVAGVQEIVDNLEVQLPRPAYVSSLRTLPQEDHTDQDEEKVAR